ncbi:DUF4190 domain-containing protein [Mycetocola saprophilus]|uniref:DUF4190 domain-containing protein n=1 Tax=Mycetocola saprophilus TaxID=76636 RepID=UPI003BEF5CB2
MSNFESPTSQTPQAPYYVPPTPDTTTPARGLAIAALVVGGVAFLLGWLPFVGALLGIVAVALGVIALVKRQPKAFALTGTILGACGLIASLIITIVTSLAVGAAIDGAQTRVPLTSQQSSASDADDSARPSKEGLGTRENPLPLGTSFTVGDYTVVVNSVALNQNDEVVAASPVNEVPADGRSFAVANVTVTYTGADSTYGAMVLVGYVTEDGQILNGLEDFALAPAPRLAEAEIVSGGTATGNVALAIPDGDQGVLRIIAGAQSKQAFVSMK